MKFINLATLLSLFLVSSWINVYADEKNDEQKLLEQTRYKNQFKSHNYFTAKIPATPGDFKLQYPSLKYFLFQRQRLRLDKSNIKPAIVEMLNNKSLSEMHEYNHILFILMNYFNLDETDAAEVWRIFNQDRVEDPNFVGVRHVTHDEPDVDFIVRPRVLEGLRVLERHEVPFDLLFYVHHLRHVPTLARYLPNLPLVIDHLSKPPIKQRRTDEWTTNFKNAAACANVSCKLSGMVTEADWNHWKPADLKPYVQLALDLFGPERCMFGSDWPVCELAATYAEVHEALVEAVGPISQDERAAIFGGTARKFYKLQL